MYAELLLRHYTLRKRRNFFRYSKVADRSVSRPRPEYKCAIPDYIIQLLAFRKCGCFFFKGGGTQIYNIFSTKEKQKSSSEILFQLQFRAITIRKRKLPFFSLRNGESNDQNFKFLYLEGRGLSIITNGIHSRITF